MPTITAFPNQTRAWVRVEVNWADVPSVEYARVLRYNTVTGECVPLRPYVCYDGDYLLLSCGHGIFFDTEVPLDTEVYYITEGMDAPCIPADPLLLDVFGRTSASTWTTATTGQTYSIINGVNGDYTVTPGVATISATSAGSDRISWANVGQPDQDALVLAQPIPAPFAPPTGGSVVTGLATRIADANNYYLARLFITTTGAVSLQLNGRVGGTLLGGLATATLTGVIDYAASPFYIRMRVVGSLLQARAWQASAPEPDIWQVEATDTNLTTGDGAGVLFRRETGNLTPTTFSFNRFQVDAPCVPCTPVTADTSADPSTIASNGQFWLRDPVRPCNDRAVPLCFTQDSLATDADGEYCVPGSGIFFASMETEAYESNTLTLNPTNARRPLAMSRQRRDVASVLTLVTRTFDDRDALLELAAPGSPLLFQGPTAYGIPLRYMDISTVSVQRGLSDHKFQVRVFNLPFVAVDRPAGPSQGTCGSQVDDMCDIYATWDEMAAAGLTWDDLIRGRAGGETAPDFDAYRTWDEVEAGFASWNAVDNGTRTWIDLETGS